MSWATLTEADFLLRFTPQEQATLKNIQGAVDQVPSLLADAVAEMVGSAQAGGYPVNTDGTSPGQYKNQILAVARWELLTSFPALKALQTDARKQAALDARKVFAEIAAQKRNVEPPASAPPQNPASGMWNSENKLVPRSHPIPPPGTQFQDSDPGEDPNYANPNAPQDQQQE